MNRIVGYSLSSIASAHLILWLICFRGAPITSFLLCRPIQHLGMISYTLYLVHMPIALILKRAVGPAMGIDLSDGLPRLAAVWVVSLVVATLSWYYFENPVLKLKDRWFPRPS